MKISRSTGYGLIALGYIAQNSKDKPVLSQRVSKEYDIPLEYLLKILQSIVRAGILNSKRGPRGGFTMGRPANKITLLEVIEAVEGPMLSHLELAQQTNNEPFAVKMEKACEQATNQARDVLGKATLSSMLKK